MAIISLLNSTSGCNFGLMRPKLLKLLTVGESPRAKLFDAVELAAWTGLCNLLLNLDEVETKE